MLRKIYIFSLEMSELDVINTLMEKSRGRHHCHPHWTFQTPWLNPDALTLLHTALVSPQLHRNIFPVLIQEDANQELPIFGLKIFRNFRIQGMRSGHSEPRLKEKYKFCCSFLFWYLKGKKSNYFITYFNTKWKGAIHEQVDFSIIIPVIFS